MGRASTAEAKNEKFKSSEGLEASEQEMKDAFEDEDTEPLEQIAADVDDGADTVAGA